MNRLKKTYEKRNVTQPKVNHKSHIQHIQTLTNEMEQLREREHRLAERLISEQPLINELRHSPRFIKETDKSCLAALVDDVYNNFTSRLTTRFPNLTEMDIQYCILIKLHFTVSQIAVLSAISPTSVYQQKSRMKKRIQALEPELFTDGETHPDTGARALHRWRNTGRVAQLSLAASTAALAS